MSYSGTAAQSPLGGEIAINTSSTSTPTWTPIAEVKDAQWSSRVNKTADATNLSSTAEEFIATLPSSGTLDVTCNRVSSDAGQLAVEAAWRARTIVQYQLTYPKNASQTTSGDVYVFKAIVEEASPAPSFKPDAVIDYKFRLKINQLDTFTAGS